MTREERRAMKAACVQTAATLIAAWDSGKGRIDARRSASKLTALLRLNYVPSDDH